MGFTCSVFPCTAMMLDRRENKPLQVSFEKIAILKNLEDLQEDFPVGLEVLGV